MLSKNPDNRISISDALKHRFFSIEKMKELENNKAKDDNHYQVKAEGRFDNRS